MRRNCHFTAVWEFHVRIEKTRAFENVYGPAGDWARLFRLDEGYLGTELVRDHRNRGRYFTFDFWISRQAYQRFKKQHAAAYKSLDKKCNLLTESETLIGEFSREVLPRSIRTNVKPQAKSSSSGHVRPAIRADVPGIFALEQSAASAAHWSEESYRHIFDDGAPPRIALVRQEPDGRLAGFIVARVAGGDCELENIVVQNSAQREGIGSALLQALRVAGREQGVTRILLEVRESNAPARALYERYGFKVTARRTSYYANPVEDALIYTLEKL
jgi:ribosomal-protein-alanine acetyltransferase